MLLFHTPLVDLINRIYSLDADRTGVHLKASLTSAGAVGFDAGVQAAAQVLGLSPEATSELQRKTAVQASSVSATIATSAGSIARSTGTSPNAPLLQGKILWVDEHPTNNLALSNAFQALGITVIQSTTNEEALTQLGDASFDVIITSMTRGADHENGLKLVEALHSKGITVPVIIYAAQWAGQNAGKENQFRVQKITNEPSVVYQVVLQDVQAARKKEVGRQQG